jgi:site-specific recombinase XerD
VSRRFRHYRKEANLPAGFNFHSTRHTFASWAVMGGMDIYKLKESLGHASIEQTMIYAHL